MTKTTYKIPKMDCAAEESIVRMKLEGITNIKGLRFDIANRELAVIHEGEGKNIGLAIDSLNFNSSAVKSESINEDEFLSTGTQTQERKMLLQVLAINFSFFLLEIITGLIAGSMGLIADSLDMLADSFIYALALFVVGKALSQKRKIARVSGYLQLLLAAFGFVEVVRRFSGYRETPNYKTMIIVSIFALVGNSLSLYLLQKSKGKEVHIKASAICTSTDVIVNAGVIAAGILVYLTASNLPDLLIGTIVFALVAYGSYRILKL